MVVVLATDLENSPPTAVLNQGPPYEPGSKLLGNCIGDGIGSL